MEPLHVALEPFDVESWPLSKLRDLQEERLRIGLVLERAACSSLYAGRWPRLTARGGRRLVQALPFTSASDLLEVETGRRLRRLAVAPVHLWLSSASATERKWMPFAAQDLLRTMGLTVRLSRLLRLAPGEVLLMVTPPAPLFQNGLPYFWAQGDRWEGNLHLEVVSGSMVMAEHNNWPEFAVRRQPAMLVARPSDALALARRFAQAVGAPEGRPRDAFRRLRLGLFYGEPLEPVRAQLEEAYGCEALSCYASVEFPYYACECPAHLGLHVWLDLALPEVIVGGGGRPEAVFLDEAPPGTEGELAVTTFAQALPMVRYRTGDRVRVVSTEPCPCGCTHPRIQVLGRL